MGNGHGTGIGSGDGAGIGAGSGGNIGGGPMHIGGSVQPPSILYKIDPEFSEERAKRSSRATSRSISGSTRMAIHPMCRLSAASEWVWTKGPSKAVRQYKFKPATQNGKPVKVDLYVNVNFTIM